MRLGQASQSTLRPQASTSQKGGNHMSRSGTIMAATIVLAAAAASLAPSASHAETYAYVGNADSNDISVFKFEAATGEMAPMQTAAFVGVEKPGSSTPLAVSPDKRVL